MLIYSLDNACRYDVLLRYNDPCILRILFKTLLKTPYGSFSDSRYDFRNSK